MLRFVAAQLTTIDPVPNFVEASVLLARKMEFSPVRLPGVDPDMGMSMLRVLVSKSHSSGFGERLFQPLGHQCRRSLGLKLPFKRDHGAVVAPHPLALSPLRLKALSNLGKAHRALA